MYNHRLSLCIGTGYSLIQDDIDYMASNVQIRYDVVDNLIDGSLRYKARVTIQNKGDRIIPVGAWAIYFCSIRIIEPNYVVVKGPGVKLSHINGCLHKIEPTRDFKNLDPGSHVEVEFMVKYFAVARTDIMPNWYFAAKGLVAKTIKNTEGEALAFVGDFKTEHQWKRYTGDKYNPYSPEERFDKIDVTDLGSAPLLLVPTPLNISGWEKEKKMKVNSAQWTITADKGLEKEASYLAG